MVNQIIKLLFCITLIVVSLLVGMMAFVTDTDATASLKWPAVAGAVKATKIEKLGKIRNFSFSPVVFYSYVVNDKTYEGSILTEPEPSFSTEKEAQEIINQYPEKSQVQVYYNPQNPEQAYLIRGKTRSGQKLIWYSIVLFIGSSVFFVMQLRRVLGRRW